MRLPVPPPRQGIKIMEATPGFEPGVKELQSSALPLGYVAISLERKTRFELATLALARRCSTTEPLPQKKWCLEAESNHRHEDFQSSALPTELSRQNLAELTGIELAIFGMTGRRDNRYTTAPCWWAMTGSNRRHLACKASALPAELIAHDLLTKVIISQLKIYVKENFYKIKQDS